MGVFTQYSDTIIKPGLERIKFFLTKLGNPQNRFTTILVGGTNGKGSTVSFLYSMLRSLGVKVGAYLSPHIHSLEERVLLPEEEKGELKGLLEEMKAKAQGWGIDLSPFELLTSAIFVLFSNCELDLAVLEVGLGGRWDATNVSNPIASVIVSLGIDHTQYLGSTLASIAREKLLIARKGIPLVLGDIPVEGLRVLKEGGRALGARIHEWQLDFFVLGEGSEGFCYVGEKVIPSLKLKLEGPHQRVNASLALRTMEVLGFSLTPPSLAALQETWLPGRMQVETVDGVPVVFDVAHNPLALKALVDGLGRRFGNRPLWAVFKLLKDKPWGEAIKIILEGFERLFFLETPSQDDREVPKVQLEGSLPLKSVASKEDWEKVMEEARKEGAVVVFTGSFRAVREGLDWLAGRG